MNGSKEEVSKRKITVGNIINQFIWWWSTFKCKGTVIIDDDDDGGMWGMMKADF